MNKETITPDRAIVQVCAITGLSVDQYGELVLLSGQVYCYHLIRSLVLVNVSERFVHKVCKELLQNNVHGFWPFWQNQVFLKNKLLITMAEELVYPTRVAEGTLRSMLRPDRIRAEVTTSTFRRKIQALVINMAKMEVYSESK